MYLSRSLEEIGNPLLVQLLEGLLAAESELGLKEAIGLVGFPTYKDADNESVQIPLLLLSQQHGAVLFHVTSAVRADSKAFKTDYEYLNHAYNCMVSRLVRNNKLAKGRMQIAAPVLVALFAPNLDDKPADSTTANDTKTTLGEIRSFFNESQTNLSRDLFYELVSTSEGSKAMDKPIKRATEGLPENARGVLAQTLEAEIRQFDNEQRRAFAVPMTGPERIRGLAGSGKTVVLAMKAAKTHFDYPDAQILYTFWTKSLYQHVRSLITRFTKMFSEQPPDWDKLQVMHGWGSADTPGVYRTICAEWDQQPRSFQEASKISKNPFNFLCEDLAKKIQPEPLYDFVFIDEGQDFPASFVRLVNSVTRENKFVLAYDELQTIFQPKCPTEADIFGVDTQGLPKASFKRDELLKTCYRNPSEILVVAHAIGFGLYLKRKTQIFNTAQDWEEIGYEVKNPPLEIGKETIIERLPGHALNILTLHGQTIDDIVQCFVEDSPQNEAKRVAQLIQEDLQQGLLPQEVMVVTVDDTNAKTYLNVVGRALAELQIPSYNLHTSPVGDSDFQIPGQVTLTTVHKAKGNEAFVVYIVGADAAASNLPRLRNMLFTAITRAKGWVRVLGTGAPAATLKQEIELAKANYPFFKFIYPNPDELIPIDRDLQSASAVKSKLEKDLEQILSRARKEMSEDEIQSLVHTNLQAQAKRDQFKELWDDDD
jgi:superfamily I DNA and RNA helicase